MAGELARLALRHPSLRFWPVGILCCLSLRSAVYPIDRICRCHSIHVSAYVHWRHWTRARIPKRLPSSFNFWDIPKPIRNVPSTLGGVGVLACRPLFYLRLLRYTLDRDDRKMSDVGTSSNVRELRVTIAALAPGLQAFSSGYPTLPAR